MSSLRKQPPRKAIRNFVYNTGPPLLTLPLAYDPAPAAITPAPVAASADWGAGWGADNCGTGPLAKSPNCCGADEEEAGAGAGGPLRSCSFRDCIFSEKQRWERRRKGWGGGPWARLLVTYVQRYILALLCRRAFALRKRLLKLLAPRVTMRNVVAARQGD